MTKEQIGVGMRRAILAGSLAVGIVGIATAAWLPGFGVSTWRELYVWYNPAAGFQSAALPVGFEDLVDRIKPTVVGIRAKARRNADEEDLPTDQGAPTPNRFDFPKGGGVDAQRSQITTQGSGFFISPDGYAMTTNHLVDGSEKIEV